jgi:integrase
VGSIRRPREGRGWEARYRDPSGRQRSAVFRTKREAERFLARVGADQQRGEWRDPRLAKVRFERVAEEWLKSTTHLRAGTRANVEIRLRRHILPCFAAEPIGAIQPAHVRAWVSGLTESGLSPSTVVAIYGVLRRIMRTAEIDGLIHRTPCLGISLPIQTSHQEMHFLDHSEVARLAADIDERYRALIFTAAYTGLRWGELVGLRVDRVNLLRGTVDVVEAMTETNGHLATRRRRPVLGGPCRFPAFSPRCWPRTSPPSPLPRGSCSARPRASRSGGTSTAGTSNRPSAAPASLKR